MTMQAIRELADLVVHVTAYGPTAVAPRESEPVLANTRELTVTDIERMYPSLFRDN